ncbi:hypothetical protein NIES39_A06200 [Arthrospira platensis NIES-39]|nr:hypothetical protein NIES39_A06200 [Arthrospira platensis NIES-39]
MMIPCYFPQIRSQNFPVNINPPQASTSDNYLIINRRSLIGTIVKVIIILPLKLCLLLL